MNQSSPQQIEYCPDACVDLDLDQAIRNLLVISFPKDPIFAKQRFNQESPQHRFFVREGPRLIAHVAVHDKAIGSDFGDLKVAGVAEVCVSPQHRGQHLVRRCLEFACSSAQLSAAHYALLFGDARFYTSSGFTTVGNPIRFVDGTGTSREEIIPFAMVRNMSRSQWPSGRIDLRGPLF